MKTQPHFRHADAKEQFITDVISPRSLLRRRATELRVSRALSGAYWFRVAAYWFRLNHGYNNPLNWGSVHSELVHLWQLRPRLAHILKDRTLVFYGVGVGDTEMVCVDAQLDVQKTCESILIDVNKEFLCLFVKSLANRRRELPGTNMTYLAYHGLFELMEARHLAGLESQFKAKAFVCLGSTIGNFATADAPFGIFSRLASDGDVLVLGYQLPTHLQETYNKYSGNGLYLDLIGNFLPPHKRQQIKWRLNEEEASIEAWLRNVQVFRSKKFQSADVLRVATSFGWKELFQSEDVHRNVALHAFIKSTGNTR